MMSFMSYLARPTLPKVVTPPDLLSKVKVVRGTSIPFAVFPDSK